MAAVEKLKLGWRFLFKSLYGVKVSERRDRIHISFVMLIRTNIQVAIHGASVVNDSKLSDRSGRKQAGFQFDHRRPERFAEALLGVAAMRNEAEKRAAGSMTEPIP